MAIRTLRRRLLIKDDRFASNHACLRVTFVTRNSRMPSLQRKMRSRIVIKSRRNPPLRIMTIGTGRLAGFRKLARMGVFMAILANLRSPFELHLRAANRRFVTITTLHKTMRAKQGKFRFRMIESADVRPGPCVVASFAA